MKQIILFAFFICVFTFTAFAQEYDLGKPAELKGLTKIFINTDGDLKNRTRIEKKIAKAKIPNLVFVDEAADAEMIIMFSGESRTAIVGATANQNGNTVLATPIRVALDAGGGALFVAGRDKARLIFRYSNQQESKWEDTPAVKLAAEFVKYYKQANNLK